MEFCAFRQCESGCLDGLQGWGAEVAPVMSSGWMVKKAAEEYPDEEWSSDGV
jgi:hypothetical protein